MKSLFFFLLFSLRLFSQNENVGKINEADVKTVLINPIIQAKQSWPRAKRNFLQGLKSSEILQVSCFINSLQNKRVQTFIRVCELNNDSIFGMINIDDRAADFKLWDPVRVHENDIIDWSIVNFVFEDSTVDGNFTTKFILKQPTQEETNAFILSNWKSAKTRFLNGLKPNEKLEVTVKKRSDKDSTYYIAIHVLTIVDGKIIGKASESVGHYSLNDNIEAFDEEIIDWKYH